MSTSPQPDGRLRRELGTFGAVMMGLGSIVGTGVFVSIGVAAGITGPSVVLAIAIGGAVATFNGLSSAQLAAAHPVSGGTYEYGYRFLTPRLGFTAGWTFLLAKSASAATAALGFAGYALGAFGVEARAPLVPLALLLVATLTAVVLAGLRRSNVTNIVIVTVTLASLAFFVVAGLPTLFERGGAEFVPFFAPEPGRSGISALLYASALMFVVYTGYGRIATLGEEVRAPQVTIPRAIVAALVVVMALYAAVAVVGVGTTGAAALADVGARTAPLETAAAGFGMPGAPQVLAVGAVGILIAGLALLGDVRTTWSFSAFTVLVYYAITNLAALRLPAEARRWPRWVSIAGITSCLGLAFFVEPAIWGVGLALVAAGLAWHEVRTRLRAS